MGISWAKAGSVLLDVQDDSGKQALRFFDMFEQAIGLLG
ncbi:hypothetical protein B8V81_0176 [Paenibacillus pasadenensis]|uniref:Uncharacterized protein n=1 Tax=Paenibacillus pasadenensis TaxID=217090 RepID=A0A2N5NCH8_9BACL|nr:hypothetical protein B8V81_0176 [Paenibacillus pasadenensis]